MIVFFFLYIFLSFSFIVSLCYSCMQVAFAGFMDLWSTVWFPGGFWIRVMRGECQKEQLKKNITAITKMMKTLVRNVYIKLIPHLQKAGTNSAVYNCINPQLDLIWILNKFFYINPFNFSEIWEFEMFSVLFFNGMYYIVNFFLYSTCYISIKWYK